MSNGTDLAADVAAAYAEASAAVGDGALIATITRAGTRTGPAYAPVIGPPTTHTAFAVIGQYSARERALGGIDERDVRISIGVMGIEPSASDSLVIGGVSYDIQSVMPAMDGGVIYSWTIRARL